ncbi:DUF4330 domain-containing protein [Natrarchaeobius oligotrophus]|uniref:DUF4330 family protein n=1 Tax=Natrarchaeobius chitinivorans TaxID=1679083 RepID=A0A3N6MRU8_NATCH|nr:DUF4330 domain-containing protein [Natrarchaeobius chitinivorans]RQH00501.1 DUF4330 family protein [Natrarchaeobius chitinivorans]
MSVIDENGDLFGVVNVIDAIAIVLVVSVLAAGVAVVTGGDGAGTNLGAAGALAVGLLLVALFAGVAVVSDDGPRFETRYATVDLGEQPAYVAERLEAGDVASLEETDEGVTVTDVYATPVTDRPRVTIRTELDGVTTEDDRGRSTERFADVPLKLGRELRLDFGAYGVDGTITDVGADPDLPLDATTTTVELEARNVSPAVARGLEVGMTETVRGETVATVEAAEREPATVVLESDDGTVHEREHPRHEDVTLTVRLQTVESETGLAFRDDRIGIGTTIELALETLTVEGEITRIGDGSASDSSR